MVSLGAVDRFAARLATAAAFLFAAACSDQPIVAPRTVSPGNAAFSIVPTFATIPAGGPVIPLSRLAAVLTAPNGDAVNKDVPFVGDSAVLTFEVPVVGSSASFILTVTAFDQAGVAAFSGSQQLTLHPGDNPIPASPLLVPDGPDAKVAALHIAPGGTTIAALATTTFSVSGTNAGGQAVEPLRVGWTSRDPTIATVDQNGAVQAGQSQGTTYIVARAANGVADSVLLKVRAPVDHVVFTPPTLSLTRGKTVPIAVELRDVTNHLIDDRAITWSTSDAAIVSISAAGTATAVKIGTATITASSEGKSATLPVTVTTPIDHIELTGPLKFASLKQSIPLVTKIVPVGGASIDGVVPRFSSSAPAVATVDSLGIVRSVSNGTARITAELDGSTASVDAVVAQVAATVATTPHELSVSTLTGTGTITTTAVDANANTIDAPKVTWKSSDTTVAVVDGTGPVATVTARRAGSTQISATVDGKTDATTFVVAPVVAKLLLTASAPRVALGESITLTARYADAAGNPLSPAPAVIETSTPQLVSLEADSAASASVLVTGVETGIAHFVASVQQFTATLDVPVVDPQGPLMVVIGDADVLTDDAFSHAGTSQRTFWTNLFTNTSGLPRSLQHGVVFYTGHAAQCATLNCNPEVQGQLRSTLASMGLNVADVDDATAANVAAAINSSVSVLVIFTPTVSFSASEITALKAFVNDGGRLIFIGEERNDYAGDWGDIENSFLWDMGTAIFANSDIEICDDAPTLPAGSLRASQLTAGVTSLWVQCVQTLFVDEGGVPIIFDGGNELVVGAITRINLVFEESEAARRLRPARKKKP